MPTARTRRGRVTMLAVSSLLLWAPDAFGRPPPLTLGQAASTKEPDKARAAELFKKSAVLYRQGDFKGAIELLDEAYTLDPQPVLLYNRARAAEGLGRIDEAISGYEKFLNDEPNAPDRGAIEQRLATLRRQRDERVALEKDREARREAPPSAPGTTPQEPPHAADVVERPPSRSVGPLIVAGVGLAAIGAGAGAGALALSKKDDAVSEPVHARSMKLKDDADGFATVSTISFVTGVVLVAAGTVWLLLDRGVIGSKKHGGASRPITVSLGGLRGTF